MNSIKEEVTQADREAAAAGYFDQPWGNPIWGAQCRNGDERLHATTRELVQAFARHRLQSTSDLRAKAEGLAEALKKIAFMRPAGDVEKCSDPRHLVEQMEKIAIEAISKRDQSQ